MFPIVLVVWRLRLLRPSDHTQNLDPIAIAFVLIQGTGSSREPCGCGAWVVQIGPALRDELEKLGIALTAKNRLDGLTSHGITGAPSTGCPTVVFTANPTVSPARITAVLGFDQAVEALRPQRRSSELGSTTGMM